MKGYLGLTFGMSWLGWRVAESMSHSKPITLNKSSCSCGTETRPQKSAAGNAGSGREVFASTKLKAPKPPNPQTAALTAPNKTIYTPYEAPYKPP